MNILILSDSHSSVDLMRTCVETLSPEAVAHLGDYWEDGAILRREFPDVPFYQVPGNCDRWRLTVPQKQILTPVIGGVRFYMTHGHLHGVKSFLGALVADAAESGAQVALYGHTHRRDCHQENGLWVINPGSSGSGSAGLLTVEDGQVRDFRFLTWEDVLATEPKL